MTQLLITVINFFIDTYLLMMILQLILESQPKSFHHNLIVDSLAKYTKPLVKPFYSFIKPRGKVDYAFFSVLFLLELLKLLLSSWLQSGLFPNIFGIVIGSVGGLGKKFINIYFFIVLMAAVVNWMPKFAKHPLAQLIQSLANPLLKPVKGLIPPIKGYDLTPLITLLVLQLISVLIFGTILNVGMEMAASLG